MAVIGGLTVLAVGGTVVLGRPVLALLEWLLGASYSGKLTALWPAFIMIVLGGGVSRAGDFLLDAVRELLPKYLMYPVLPMPEIALAQLGNDAGIIGAALLGR